MDRTLRAGLAYFGIVFAIGFLLGAIRVTVLVPLVGELLAVLLEIPIVLTSAWLICRWLVRWLNVPPSIGSRLAMGGLALVLLLVAEVVLSTLVFGNSMQEHFRSYLSFAHALGLAGQCAFGMFPFIQAIGRSSRAGT